MRPARTNSVASTTGSLVSQPVGARLPGDGDGVGVGVGSGVTYSYAPLS